MRFFCLTILCLTLLACGGSNPSPDAGSDAGATATKAVLDGDEWVAVTMGGSGQTALEASIASLLPRDGRLLAVANGSDGEQIGRIAGIHGMDRTDLTHDCMDAGGRATHGAVAEG